MNIWYELSQNSNSQTYTIDIEGILTINVPEPLYDISIIHKENLDPDELIFVGNVQNAILESLKNYQTRDNKLISQSDFQELMSEYKFSSYNPRRFYYDIYDYDRHNKFYEK